MFILKKTFIEICIFILVLIAVITTISYVNNKKSTNEDNAQNVLDDAENNSNLPNTHNNKILVTYFSRPGGNYNVGNVEIGNTALMASYIVEYLDSSSFEILPVNAYSTDYSIALEEASKEKEQNARPAIKNEPTNLEDYDTIFIGYPIWHGDLPMIMYTFLENYNFDGKKIIPFNTHEGSGSAGTFETIKNKLINSNVNTNGLSLKGSIARTDEGKQETIKWLKSLGY